VSAVSRESTALEWLEPGVPAYYVETKCGRYSVSRITVSKHNAVHYIAWRLKPKRAELASTQVPLDATNEQRKEARRKMQQRCAEDSSDTHQPETVHGE